MPSITSAELIYDRDTPTILTAKGFYDGPSCLFDVIDFTQTDGEVSVVSCELSSDDSANFTCTCTDSTCDVSDRCDYRYDLSYTIIGQGETPSDQILNLYDDIGGSYTHTSLQ